jgi:uncharacterized protein (TIGR00369 family)
MDILKLYNTAQKFPFGTTIFSYFASQQAPYFLSIKPKIVELKEGRVVVEMKDRRRVRNHLNSIHAIALCNMCELAMGMATEVTIPKNLRYIPVGMTVAYKKKALGTLRAISEVKKSNYQVGSLDIAVHIFDKNNINVMSAVITLNIKEK